MLNVEVAHIHARSEGGPRWDSGMSAAENRSVDNLILLCLPHHKEIDRAPDEFPADLLREWKRRQVREADAAAETLVLTDDEVAEVATATFGVEELADRITERLPFTARSRSRGQTLDLAAREARARTRARLAAVPEARKDAVLEWMREQPPPAVVVPEGQLRVLIAPMGAGKSETAARWFQEGLEMAADDDQAEIPVWLDARSLGHSSLAPAVTEALGRDPDRPVRVVLDDLTWLPIAEANRLIDEARQLVDVWGTMRILATSRPGPQLSDHERVPVVPWSTSEGAELVRRVVDDGALHDVWSPEVRDLLTSPLLALALAARLAAGRSVQVSRTQLLADLATTILERERPQDLVGAWELLKRLAARIISTQAAVPPSELGISVPDVWPLTDSGLVIADPSGLRFALPVFEQHLGAEALRSGLVDLEHAASATSFPLWRYQIAHIVATSTSAAAEAIMVRLARVNPGAASWVLDEATNTPGPLQATSTSRPWESETTGITETDPALRAGRWLREAVEALLAGFGAYGPYLEQHYDGQLVQWGVRLHEDGKLPVGMTLTEARNRVDPDLVLHGLEAHDPFRPNGWDSWTAFELPTEALGRWRWARKRLRQELARQIKQHRLPVPETSPLAREREWVLAQRIFRIYYRRTAPAQIPIHELNEAVEQLMVKATGSVRSGWTDGSIRFDSNDVRWMRARLSNHPHDHLKSPRPASDRAPTSRPAWRWRWYSPALTVTITADVLKDALIGYHDLVTENFPNFGAALGMFSSLPLRAEGNVIIDEAGAGQEDSMWYTLKPDPSASPEAPHADFSLTAEAQPLHDAASAAVFRRRQFVFHRPMNVLTRLPTGDDLAATGLAYRWLSTDLKTLGW